MEKTWVMSEAERRKMMEQRQERKFAAAAHHHPNPPPAVVAAVASSPTPTEIHKPIENFKLSPEIMKEIEHIEEYYKQSYKANPYSSDMSSLKGSKGVLETWMQFCKKIGHFFSLFEDFSSLCQDDQAVLLRTAMTSAGIIMGSVTYESWIGKRKGSGGAGAPVIPKISFDNIEKLVPGDLLYRVKTFFKKFQHICPDETMAKILMLVSLYSPEMAGLKDERKVQSLQEHYIDILDSYLKYKFGVKSGRMFANALVSLADVRELAERSLEMEIRHSALAQLAAASSDSSSSGGNGSDGGNLTRPDGGEDGGPSGEGGGSGGVSGRSSISGSSSNAEGSSDADGIEGSSATGIGFSSGVPSQFISRGPDPPMPPTSQYNPSTPMDWSESPAPSTRYRHSQDEGILSKRQVSQLRIQELIASIPPPAIMKIIYHMSEDLDIEAKKTEAGIKFLRKNRSTQGATRQRVAPPFREQSLYEDDIKKEYPSCSEQDNYPAMVLPEPHIKTEKMDLDEAEETVEFNAIQMLSENLDATDSRSGNSEVLQSSLSFRTSPSHRTAHGSMHHFLGKSAGNFASQHESFYNNDPHLPVTSSSNPPMLGGALSPDLALVNSRSMSPMNFPHATVSSDIMVSGPPLSSSGAYDSSLALVPSGDSRHYRHGDSCPSPQLPFSNNLTSGQGLPADKTPAYSDIPTMLSTSPITPPVGASVYNSAPRPAIGTSSALNKQTSMPCGDGGMNALPPGAVASSFPPFDDKGSMMFSQARSSASLAFVDSKDNSTSQHRFVQRQIMHMSIHSPSSPTDSNCSVSSNGDKVMTHFRGHVSHFPTSHGSPTPSLVQLHHSTLHHDRYPSSSPHKDHHTMRNMDPSLMASEMHGSTSYPPCSPATPSPSPSVSSLRSSSSNGSACENSSEQFSRTLYTFPLNLTGLSDVESSVLHKFFEHISAHLSSHRSEGQPWNSDDVLPKPFLEMLQAELENEQQK